MSTSTNVTVRMDSDVKRECEGIYGALGFEVTPAAVIGFLTILGYSLYDTVVVFDKVRENTHEVTKQTRVTYAEQANLAVNQTLVRSINTSVVGVQPLHSNSVAVVTTKP